MTMIPGMGYVPDRPSDPPDPPECPDCGSNLVVTGTGPWTAPHAECFDCGYDSDDERLVKVFVLTAEGEYGEWHDVVGVYSTYELAREAEAQRERPGTITTITRHTVHETRAWGT